MAEEKGGGPVASPEGDVPAEYRLWARELLLCHISSSRKYLLALVSSVRFYIRFAWKVHGAHHFGVDSTAWTQHLGENSLQGPRAVLFLSSYASKAAARCAAHMEVHNV